MDNSRSISGNMLGDHAQIIQGDVHTTVHAAISNADSLFLQEISKTNPVHDKRRIMDLKGPFLYQLFCWILDYQDFNTWRNNKQSGVFWIKGDPGKGKTMLLCGLIEEFEKDPEMKTNVSYFFCQATDFRINTAVAVLGGLVFSILRKHGEVLSRIRKSYEKEPKGQFEGPNAWTVLCDIFNSITRELTDIICVVDALDECEGGCKLLLDLIIKTSGDVKWLVSSRNIKEIERKFHSIDSPQILSLELKVNAEYVSNSVDAYVDVCIQSIHAIEDDYDLRTKTIDALKSKANGTFLWVALVIEQLRDADHRHVEDVLEVMPEGLEGLYDLIRERSTKFLRKADQDACNILLSIVAAAERPLRLEELRVFIASQWKQYKPTYDLRDLRDIVKDCGSFLSIQNETVYFVHQSAKDYMVENMASIIFPLGLAHQHHQMFTTSINALSTVLKHDIYDLKAPGIHIDEISPPSPDPLAPVAYCCIFWVEHLVRSCESEGFKYRECLKDDGILYSFFKEKYLCWLEALILLRNLTPLATIAIQKLQGLILSGFESEQNSQPTDQLRQLGTDRIKELNDDAYRFLLYYKDYLRFYPLQIYLSLMAYEDHNCTIRKTFQQAICADFPRMLPAIIRRPWSQCTLLQNLVPPDPIPDVVLFSPDSTLVGVLSKFYGTIALWRVDTGNLVCKISTDLILDIAFIDGSRNLISVSNAGSVKIWSTDNGACIRESSLNVDKGVCYQVGSPLSTLYRERIIALSPNGCLAASGRPIFETIKIWQTQTGHCVCNIELRKKNPLPAIVFSPNCELIAIVHPTSIGVYCTKTGQAIHEWAASKAEHLIFSPNSKYLAAIMGHGEPYVWETNSWERLHHAEETVWDNGSTWIDFSPDSAILAVAHRNSGISLRSLSTGEYIAEIAGANIDCVRFSPNWTRSLIVGCVTDGTLQIWRVDTSRSITKMKDAPNLRFTGVVISPDSRLFASWHWSHEKIGIWDTTNGNCIHVLRRDSVDDRSLNYSDPRFSPDSKLLASPDGGGSRNVRVWNTDTGCSFCLLQGRATVVSIAFSLDSKTITVGDRCGAIWVWCLQPVRCLNGFNWDRSVTCVAFSPNSKYTASASEDSVWIQPLVSGGGTVEFVLESGDTVEKLEFSPDSTILAAVLLGTVVIWEVATGNCLGRIDIWGDRIPPSIDFIKGQILTERFALCKTISWNHWDRIPRPGYSIVNERPDPWVYLDGKRFFWIAKELDAGYACRWAVSGSLLAFACLAEQLVIIHLPPLHGAQQQAVEVLL